MFRIRYYDKMIHPEHFSKGMLGWTIRVLNWLRWKLEVRVQGLVLKYLCKEGDLPEQKRLSLREMFSLDVEAERFQAKSTAPHVEEVVEESRSERYQAGGPRSVLDQAKQTSGAPAPLDELASRYTAAPRARRYARGRSRFLVESEDAFEPVPAASKGSGE